MAPSLAPVRRALALRDSGAVVNRICLLTITDVSPDGGPNVAFRGGTDLAARRELPEPGGGGSGLAAKNIVADAETARVAFGDHSKSGGQPSRPVGPI
jgi:hypothetical protein